MKTGAATCPVDGVPSLGIHPRILVPASFPAFGVYSRPEDDTGFRRLIAPGEPVYANTWRRLQEQGIDVVYVRGEERNACFDYVEEHLPHVLSANGPPGSHGAEWVYRLTCRVLDLLLEDRDSLECYRRLAGLADILTEVILTRPDSEWRMLECAPLRHRTHTHCVNVAVLLVSFCHHVLKVDDDKLLRELALGGVLHDLGKTLLPREILDKPGRLTDEEFDAVKKHPTDGLRIAGPWLHDSDIAQRVIAQHHEDACGSGYPDGRVGQAINKFARAARVADVFDALTSSRPYSDAMDTFGALNHMVVHMQPRFDRTLLRRFIRLLSADRDGEAPVTVAVPAGDEAPQELIPALVAGPPIADAEPLTQRGTAPAAPHPAQPAEEETSEEEPLTVDDLLNQQEQSTALFGGIMRALNDAVEMSLQKREQAPEQPPDAHVSASPASPSEEAAAARALFPLVWQIDRWRAEFAPRERAQESPLRARILACLELLRADVEDALAAYHVEIIEPAPSGEDGLHAQRAGFVLRHGEHSRVLEPVRIGLKSKRRAG